MTRTVAGRTAPRRPPGSTERGAGVVLAVAIIAATLALFALSVPLYLVSVARHQASAAAELAALAAADVAVGIHPGHPCPTAESVAAANGVSVVGCRADGLVVTVRIAVETLGAQVTSTATAGPPPGS